MQKQEFEERIERTVTDEQYKVIEERVKYNTMVKRVLRKQESFVTKTEKSENGGKDVVLVAVSSLSKQARNA